MRRALELAELGRGHVSPNPMVGCVITHDHKIIGEGFHQKYGNAHAEVNAINAVQDDSLLPKSTVYVTLEPCSHHGKTPPCADLLIEKRVKRVVIACQDPFDKVDGRGIKRMKAAGIEVEVGTLEKEATELNIRFFTAIQKKRPYVILKWAQTADGFIARENYDSKWISNQYSRQLVHQWRAEEDAILVGKNTAIYDNPRLTVREWTGKNPVRILLDSNLEVSTNTSLFDNSAPTLIFNTKKEEKQGHIEWVKANMDSPSGLLKILQKRKIQSVIIEGGSQVLNSFISEKCWDEARVFTSNSTFEKGILAPNIGSLKGHKTSILNDQLSIYHNHHG